MNGSYNQNSQLSATISQLYCKIQIYDLKFKICGKIYVPPYYAFDL